MLKPSGWIRSIYGGGFLRLHQGEYWWSVLAYDRKADAPSELVPFFRYGVENILLLESSTQEEALLEIHTTTNAKERAMAAESRLGPWIRWQ